MESGVDLLSRVSVSPRWRIGLGAAVVLILGALATAVLVAFFVPGPTVQPIEGGAAAEDISDDTAEVSVAPASILVHVSGQVREPGVYELTEGSRVVDAVAAAGGLMETSATDGLNLARVLSDGEQVLVPAEGEQLTGAGSAVTDAGGRINLNTANAEQLDTLPRIGPALADRIIGWREEHGRFAAVDDLLSVPGIGSATFEGLRDLVSVG